MRRVERRSFDLHRFGRIALAVAATLIALGWLTHPVSGKDDEPSATGSHSPLPKVTPARRSRGGVRDRSGEAQLSPRRALATLLLLWERSRWRSR